MSKKKKKAKQNKFIAKISRDGKISKKEAKQAAKKGISLAKIERNSLRSFLDAKKEYEDKPSERRGPNAPTYTPLLISRGANRIFNPTKSQTTSTSKPKPKPDPKPTTPTTPTTPYSEEIDTKTNNLQEQLKTLTDKYTSTTGQLSTIQGALQEQKDTAATAALEAEKRYKAMQKAARQAANKAQNRFNKAQSRYEAQSAASAAAFNEQMAAREENFNQALSAQAAQFEEQMRLEMEQRALGERTFMANQLRASAADPSVKLGTPSVSGAAYGTNLFKRRKDFLSTVFQGIQPTMAATIGGINI
jgi:hypothetical protein